MPVRSDIINAVAAAAGHVVGLAAVTKYRATPARTLPCLNLTAALDLRNDERQQFATYRQPLDPRTLDVTAELRVAGADEAAATATAEALLLSIERHTIGTGSGAAVLAALVSSGKVLDFTWDGVAFEVEGAADRVVMRAEIAFSFSYLPPAFFYDDPVITNDEWPEIVAP